MKGRCHKEGSTSVDKSASWTWKVGGPVVQKRNGTWEIKDGLRESASEKAVEKKWWAHRAKTGIQKKKGAVRFSFSERHDPGHHHARDWCAISKRGGASSNASTSIDLVIEGRGIAARS